MSRFFRYLMSFCTGFVFGVVASIVLSGIIGGIFHFDIGIFCLVTWKPIGASFALVALIGDWSIRMRYLVGCVLALADMGYATTYGMTSIYDFIYETNPYPPFTFYLLPITIPFMIGAVHLLRYFTRRWI